MFHVVDHIVLHQDSNRYSDNLILVDAPGVNDINPIRSDITIRYLKQSNVILLVLTPERIATENLFNTLKELIDQRIAEKLILIINKIDLIDHQSIKEFKDESAKAIQTIKDSLIEESNEGYVVEYIKDVFSNIDIYPISAINSHKEDVGEIYQHLFDDFLKKLNVFQFDTKYSDARIKKHFLKYSSSIDLFEEKILEAIQLRIEGDVSYINSRLVEYKIFKKR